ncbi:hypothetical protein ACFT30_13570 [Microbacterium ureisolvens]|uniref:hypothetical protein n=1 Tax=Microbacterium ureisolvens TaxID=2781186 RepID=UPI003629765D
MSEIPTSVRPATRRRPLGLSTWSLIGLAAVALPRVLLHDLHLIDEGSAVAWLLAVGPVVLWIAVAVVKRVPNPFLTVLVIGAIFGAMLVITHQLLWDVAFAGSPPSIGDGPGATLIPRFAAILSGLFTGTMMGAIGGLIAWGVQAILRRPQR